MAANKSKRFWLTIGRSLIGRCPNCGKGRLFKSYLKQVENCSECGEDLGHIQADDGPSWLTILVVGHIIAPAMLISSSNNIWPDWIYMILWPSLALILTLLILPRAKGIFIAIIWRLEFLENKK